MFDGYTEGTHGAFLPDHPRISHVGQKDRILAYLNAGETLIAYRSLSDDEIDPSRDFSVPRVFVTDGEWVWNLASAYYLEVHDLLPDARLLEHVEARGYQFPAVEPAVLERAREEAYRVVEEFPVDGNLFPEP